MRKSFKAVLSMIFVAILMSSTMLVSLAVGNISNLKATNVTHNSATITWSAASGADGYELKYTTGSTTKTVKITGRNTTSYKLSLTPGKSYTVQVRSYDRIIKTYYGSWYKVSVKAVPAKVTNFKATNLSGGTSVKLTWSKVSGVTGYVVQQYKGSKWTNIKTTTGTSYTVSSLTTGTAYKFRIAAYYKYSGKNIYSSYVSLTATPTYTASSTLKYNKITSSSVYFYWSGVSGAKNYQVYNAGTKKYSYTTSKGITLSGLEAGTEYKVRVRGYSKIGGKNVYGAWSAYLTVKTAPGKVNTVTAENITNTSVDVSWSAATGATGYQVYLYDYSTKTNTRVKATTARSYTIATLEAGKTYRIGVRGYAKIEGTYYYTGYTYAYIDTPPAITAGTETNTKDIQVQWTQVRKAKAYKLERYVPKEYKWITLTEYEVETPHTSTTPSTVKESFLDTGFATNASNHAELYRLTAYNENGDIINTTEKTVASAGITVTQDTYSATVTWNNPSNVKGYIVYKMPLEGYYQSNTSYIQDFKIDKTNLSKYTFYLTPNEYCSYMIYAERDGYAGSTVASFTVHAGQLVIDSSDESKNAQLLLLVNAINKAKLYQGEGKITTDSYAKMVLDAIYFSDAMAEKLPGSELYLDNGEIPGEDLEAFFRFLVALGVAEESDVPEIVTEEDPKAETFSFADGYVTLANGSKTKLRRTIEPSGTYNELAYLYNQHTPSAWKNGFSTLTTTYYPSTGKYKIVATLKQEKFGSTTTKDEAYYHPGFVSIYDALGFAGEGVDNNLTSLGDTKITAYIDAEGRIYNYSFTSPFSTKFMAEGGADGGVGMKMSGTTTMKYTITY